MDEPRTVRHTVSKFNEARDFKKVSNFKEVNNKSKFEKIEKENFYLQPGWIILHVDVELPEEEFSIEVQMNTSRRVRDLKEGKIISLKKNQYLLHSTNA